MKKLAKSLEQTSLHCLRMIIQQDLNLVGFEWQSRQYLLTDRLVTPNVNKNDIIEGGGGRIAGHK
jgi:hypothetical protein